MAFRGVLLQLAEAESEAGFRVVAPDAALTLPPRPAPARESFLTKWSQQKLVVADAVSGALLQVARLAAVALQPHEQSVLWGVTAPFAPPEGRTVGAAPLDSYAPAVQKTHVLTSRKAHKDASSSSSSLAAAVASPSLIARADAPPGHTLLRPRGGSEPPARLCFCFHFRSTFEFELFARAVAAFSRMQRYALLQSSVVMEMEISQEYKKSKALDGVRQQAAAFKARKRQERMELLRARRQEKKPVQQQPQTQATPKAKTKPKVAAATPPSKMLCVLCRIQRKPDAPEYPKHPFVLKDGKGEVVHICKVCLQRVLQQRLQTPQVAKGGPDNYCGLCARSTDKMTAKSIKACAHSFCTRVYCMPCIDKLIGKAQAHKVWRTKHWLCPNCSTDDDNVADKKTNGVETVPTQTVVAAAPAPKQKKRKRRNEIEESTADEDDPEPLAPASSEPEMKPLDYVVTYFKFLLKREVKDEFKESEDVCFCCKDGGDVIECDWKGMNGAFARCPKVYHEDCLGYEVPEGKTWVCPRHRCQDCGIIALYSCRFCVTSFCEDHLPKDVKKLGLATKDIPTSSYIMCPRCSEQAQDALKQKKIGSDLHSKLFFRRHSI
ncbi:set domain [Phytophthora cinnamomi]|uniref:set domain n=1 Tax=Phytophthora cinnamomi TaxID=4785 RepID=UPI003559F167|nr:set domain [Phytophthora cinnamomi]